MRKTVLFILALLALVPVALTLAGAQEDAQAEKSAFLRFVEDRISTPDRKIAIGAIDGALSSDVRLASITVSDRQGPWLRIEGVHLVWSRLALLSGTLDVNSLAAERIEVSRKPVAAQTVDPAAGEGFSLPQLPVAVKIGKLAAGTVVLGAPLVGEEVQLALEGALTLEGGSLATHFDARRIDATTGEIRLDASYAKEGKRLAVDLAVSEPEGGMLSRLLQLPGAPSIDLAVKGEGPLDAFAADVRLATGGIERLGGRITIAGAGDGYKFAADLGGDVAALVDPDYARYVGGSSSFALAGRVGADGAVAIDRLDVASPVLAVKGSAALAPDGFPLAVDLRGRLGGAGAFLPLGGAHSASGLESAAFALAFGADNAWTLDVDVAGLRSEAGRAERLQLSGKGLAENLADAGRRHLTFALSGRSSGLALADAALAAAAGGDVSFSGKGSWTAGAPLAIDGLALSTPTATAGFAGKIEDLRIRGRHLLSAPSLAPFSALAGRPLEGSLDIAAEGDIAPVTGAFELTLSGQADGLAVGVKAADGLLAGTSRLSGRVSRTTAGLAFQALKLGNDHIAATLAGHLGRQATDIAAKAQITDLAAAMPTLSGALAADVTVRGGDGPLAVSAKLASERIGLDRHAFVNPAIAFEGHVGGSGIDGHLAGGGMLDKVPLRLAADLSSDADGTQHLAGLTLSAAATRASGDLVRRPDGLVAGTLAFDSPDISVLAPLALVEASGRASGRIALQPEAGGQGAKVVLDLAAISVAGNGVGSGHLEASVADALGSARVDGSFRLADLSAAAGRIAALAGTARSEGAATRFDVKADGILAPQLADNGLSPLAATARGRFAGNRIDIEAAAVTGDGGLSVRASGALPLKGEGLDVRVEADLPLALADRLLAKRGARLTGTAHAALALSGSLAAPRYGGNATLADGTAVDPETATKITGIGFDLRLDGNAVRIDRFAAAVNGRGRLSASGSVGLDPKAGLPVDIRVKLDNARLGDGRMATADLGGDITVAGSLAGGIKVSGTLNVARAEITVPEGMGANADLLDVKHRLPPPNVRRTLARIAAANGGGGPAGGGPAVTADLKIEAPSKIFVRGRGIDAELGGTLTVSGTLPDVRPVGGFKLIRGRIQVIGQRITLDEGTVTLMGDLDPYIDFSATSKSNQIAVTASVTGYASAPKIVLSSTPDLPQDEILARFLFKRSISDLSAVQIALLADAVAQLAGGGRDNGLIDKLRGSVGLDDLDVATDAKGNTAVKAGRYISEKVYLGVSAGSAGQSGVSVNLDITDQLKARAEATTGQSKIGVYYEKEY